MSYDESCQVEGGLGKSQFFLGIFNITGFQT